MFSSFHNKKKLRKDKKKNFEAKNSLNRCLGYKGCLQTQTNANKCAQEQISGSLKFTGPHCQTSYEPKPHMKQHCCCTRQGHPWLAVSTVVAAENPTKDEVVSCRVCFVSGEIVDPKLLNDREAVVSFFRRWVSLIWVKMRCVRY